MGYYIDANGNYYEGDRQGSDIEVPMRPSYYWYWDYANEEWKLDLPRIQNAKWNAIKLEKERRSQYGGFKVGTHWVSSEIGSKIRISFYLHAGSSLPTGLEHPTMDNGALTVTPTLAQDMLTALMTNENDLQVAMIAHRDAMMALTNPESYTYTTGWPDTFASL